MRIGGDWLDDPGAQAFLAALTTEGLRGFFVGGCVRNALLGRTVGDLDIATDAAPETVSDVAQAAGFRVVPTGIAHGTVTVIAHGTPLEVTTFRKDVETDGRRAVVAFSTRVEDDAARRDFTMNALYADTGGAVIDPLGGLPDLEARRVRFIGDARARIREDYLRILRYFRFHAWYGDPAGGIDAEALAASADLADGLDRLSAERITAETLKLLAAPDPAPSVAAMAQAGILGRILPGADAAVLAPLVHLEGTLGTGADPLRRLAALGGDRVRLRLAKRESRRLDLLRHGIAAAAGTAEMAWRHGAKSARDIELLRAAAFSAPLPADLEHRIETGATAVFPVTGRDLPGLAGPELGRRLKSLEARWIASGLALDREALLATDDPAAD